MDRRKLKMYMAASGYSQKMLALDMKLSENSLSRKINGKRPFTLPEAMEICEILQIESDAERARIFLRKEGEHDDP